MRALAITGMVTASWISTILSGSAIRATPPSARMSAGTRSSAMTATAPASSAIRAWSASVTSMITPPLSISARPLFTRIVPISTITRFYPEESALQARKDFVQLLLRRGDRPEEDGVLLGPEDIADVRAELLGGKALEGGGDFDAVVGALTEGDREGVAGLPGQEAAVGSIGRNHSHLRVVGGDAVALSLQTLRSRSSLECGRLTRAAAREEQRCHDQRRKGEAHLRADCTAVPGPSRGLPTWGAERIPRYRSNKRTAILLTWPGPLDRCSWRCWRWLQALRLRA